MPINIHLAQFLVGDGGFHHWLYRHVPDLADCSDQLQDIFYRRFHVGHEVRVSDSAAPDRPARFPDMNVAVGGIREPSCLVGRDVSLGSEDRAFGAISCLLPRVGVPSVLPSPLERGIRSRASSMANETSNIGRHVIPVDVEIVFEGEEEQEPEEEGERREGEDAEEEEQADEGEEIVNEVMRYSFDQASDFAVPATKACIEAPEKAKLGGADSIDTCSICLEELSIGSESLVSRMPCSHVFHRYCIVQWLERSHMCPLCRFKMHVA